MARVGLTGVHTLPLNRQWVDIHRRSMTLAGLDPAFQGLKIIQISDLHYSPMVWGRYLIQYIRWVNELEPDLVFVTGDLITGGYRYAERVARLLAQIKSKHGVVCTFGNHDYGMRGRNSSPEGERLADHLEKCLTGRNLQVLRNQAKRLVVDGAVKPLLIVGLDDEWSGHIDPAKAFRGIGAGEPVICLNHNPVNCVQLIEYPWQWMLSGHTHGRQVGAGKIGRRLYPHRFRHYTTGYYSVKGRHLYVNRGLSYGQRERQWCRPEITVFKLKVGA
jgi:predicted MPP superfamily phosphohydrolase